MSKILVTGGAGFIGSNFIRYWLKNEPNDQITNLDKLTYAGNLDNLVDISNNSNYKFVQGDICDFDLVNSLVKKTDLIVNFAAESHVDRSIKNSSDFVKTNIEGTRVLLEAAKNNGGIRFHQISTDEVFGSLNLDDEKFNEKTPYDPRSPYSASKAAADHLVRAYFHTYNLPITVSNCSNNYGPYQFPEKLIPLFIINLIEGKKVPVYGNGQNIRDWIHVDDHNRGVKMIIEKGKIGETYCLGGNNEIKNIEITHKILDILSMGEDMIEFVEDRLGHDLRYAIDFSKAKKELAWEPEIGFSQGLENTIDWYRQNSVWWKKIQNNK
ncbi:dTDP-glucose 4,6-dehydratase [Candidatus Falkowbacteria bacterium HGW-Falkowbacteria-1]|uniref:dTDP-glucose 4,6-dehydratase n=1 Tax=Candidatus Falkowbacteria bacterium HGW-Falkowbacteria-1 TaxID=2013768 RepID=A0A2N2EA08_9BACT|nr:MAG: dTDP-glucose 4,6-dehydratase [Candidatus Falkowbacteria bacterium HGW-Falkowbacteria-1]